MRIEIIKELARIMRPQQFKQVIDSNWSTEHLLALLSYYKNNDSV